MSSFFSRFVRSLSVCACAAACGAYVALSAAPAQGQAQLSFGQQRPFVIGFIPVVGPGGGAVGGVSIDADGVVSRSDVETQGLLKEARLKALARVGAEVQAKSELRKISLRRLQSAIDECRRARKPVSDELQNLAGLTRVRFVFVYPDDRDIVLAGPAEGWKIDGQGNVVGSASGSPTLQLDDLLVALRTARNAATGEGITCSIDPTEEGLKRFQKLLKSRGLERNAATVARLEAALGQQQITVTGIPAGTRFARVLVAADFLMKRLAMDFEPSPIEGLPSYLEMLQAPGAPLPRNAMPRWWMAPHYEPLARDADSLAWELRGPGVQTLTEEGYLGKAGTVVAARQRENALAKKWADAMTSKYEELSKALPVFADLRNCIDLAVVAALLTKEDLAGLAGCDLSLLLDEKAIAIAQQAAPRTIDSRASVVRKGDDWIVSISGGVDLNSWAVLEREEVKPELATTRKEAAAGGKEQWWWD